MALGQLVIQMQKEGRKRKGEKEGGRKNWMLLFLEIRELNITESPRDIVQLKMLDEAFYAGTCPWTHLFVLLD